MSQDLDKARVVKLEALTREWIAGDPDAETAAQLSAMLAGKDYPALIEHVDGELEFGTAGLRAVVGPGPLRMNTAVIRRTTHGVAQYLLTQYPGRTPHVVVGCDARLSSPGFLVDTVSVLTANGVKVSYFEEPTATPIVAYVARLLGAESAVIITASHNPPEYNGYKLYADNAVQIVPPVDTDVASKIRVAPAAAQVPYVQDAMCGNALVMPVPQSLIDQYFSGIDALRPAGAPLRDLPVVYSAMHGVGWAPVERAFQRAGFTALSPVVEQAAPDGNFPTVRFPNPEEPGAMDLSLALGSKLNAKLILANDPDVDRLAACIRHRDGSWLQLTGNQIGLLLADFVLARVPSSPRPLTACSIVSSPMLESIADAYGARFEQTLTGFKWVWNAALDLQQSEGVKFAFGYEEALGYSAGDLARDKDGISAALLFAEMVAALEATGSSAVEQLESLYRRHGLWISVQRSVVREGSAGQAELRAAIDRVGQEPPQEIAGETVTRFVDYRTGEEERPRWLHNTPLLELRLGDAGRVLLRPSGTEPKLKVYVDLRVQLGENADVWGALGPAQKRAAEIAADVVRLCGL